MNKYILTSDDKTEHDVSEDQIIVFNIFSHRRLRDIAW